MLVGGSYKDIATHVLIYSMQCKQSKNQNPLTPPALSSSQLNLSEWMLLLLCNSLSLFQNRNRESESESESRVSFLSSPQNLRSLAFLGAMYARKSLSLSANLQITTHYVTLFFFFPLFFFFSFLFYFFWIFHSCPLLPPVPTFWFHNQQTKGSLIFIIFIGHLSIIRKNKQKNLQTQKRQAAQPELLQSTSTSFLNFQVQGFLVWFLGLLSLLGIYKFICISSYTLKF